MAEVHSEKARKNSRNNMSRVLWPLGECRLKLPAYAPELNPMENVWAYRRANKLAITVFDSHEDILDKCEDA